MVPKIRISLLSVTLAFPVLIFYVSIMQHQIFANHSARCPEVTPLRQNPEGKRSPTPVPIFHYVEGLGAFVLPTYNAALKESRSKAAAWVADYFNLGNSQRFHQAPKDSNVTALMEEYAVEIMTKLDCLLSYDVPWHLILLGVTRLFNPDTELHLITNTTALASEPASQHVLKELKVIVHDLQPLRDNAIYRR